VQPEVKKVLEDALNKAYAEYPLHGSGDGVALFSRAHPRAAWYKRLWDCTYSWVFPPKLSPDSLEDTEINIK
jgi:hypothetical protein